METQHKEFIVKELNFLIKKQSANKVANKAKVSSATISQMVNNNWDLIKDEMWLKVKSNLDINWNWALAQTSNLILLNDLLKKAQKGSMSVCVSDNAGLGKTTAYKFYAKVKPNVILIECKNYWSKKSFARHQLIAAGLEDGGTTEEMIERFSDHLGKLNKPLIIYDQFDKLKEPQKDLFMDYYNDHDGHCAFVLSGVKALKKMEENGYKRNKMGYRERYSRYGSKFISINKISLDDVTKVCNANGVTDKELIQEIYNGSLGDFRRVKREIEKHFLSQE